MQRLTITAPPEAAGERLDRFLAAGLEAPSPLSRTRLKALLLDGAVTENGAAVIDPSQSVRAEAEYALLLPPVREATPQAEDIPLDIMFEDDHIIILNKPSGMVVHPGPGQPDGTLVNALIAHCGDSLTGIGGVMRPGIVHRLDKDTSGVMMAAKSDAAHQKLTEMFAAHDLDRHYLAITWGMPPETEGRIEAALGRSTRDRKKQAVVPNGRYAATNWTVIRRLPPFASIVECRLETGRTHQIRVHMAHLGHGVIGDPMYGKPMRSGQMPDAVARDCLAEIRGFRRQALHAASLGFAHPVTGKALHFETPVPDDMAGLVAAIEAGIERRATAPKNR
ncbi:MAG: RluA family pseudouridine synthase [SAR116 cluster bacterium]|nr:RluA family pseudouridine synthase [SAR116 cluster bacterium]